VQERALVKSVAGVEVEGEVDDCGCEGEAAELWWVVLVVCGRVVCVGGTYEAGCEAHVGDRGRLK